MKKVKAIIVTGFGINCEEEMKAAYQYAGAEADIVHLNEIFIRNVSIHKYDILNFPGGFSFGDDIASGKVLANKIKFRKLNSGKTFLEEIIRFIEDKKYIFGSCNGFQVLVKTGLLPNISGNFEQEVTLTRNDSGKFIDDWRTLKITSDQSPFLKGLTTIDLPIRHGEGKLIIRDDNIRKDIIDKRLNCLNYINNPNGSELDCAGMTDSTGQILGMMPHPEAYLSSCNHPDWNRRKMLSGTNDDHGEGLQIFINIVEHIRRQ
jgi:phosphoribosylformylglycinamidine synthase